MSTFTDFIGKVVKSIDDHMKNLPDGARSSRFDEPPSNNPVDWPIYEDPPREPGRHGWLGRKDPIADWLGQVREANGQWLRYSGTMKKRDGRDIKYGVGHGAKRGEFDVRIEDFRRTRTDQWNQYVVYARLRKPMQRKAAPKAKPVREPSPFEWSPAEEPSF